MSLSLASNQCQNWKAKRRLRCRQLSSVTTAATTASSGHDITAHHNMRRVYSSFTCEPRSVKPTCVNTEFFAHERTIVSSEKPPLLIVYRYWMSKSGVRPLYIRRHFCQFLCACLCDCCPIIVVVLFGLACCFVTSLTSDLIQFIFTQLFLDVALLPI